MAIPRSMGWLVVTGLAVLTLVALSMFALDRPDVVWAAGKPQCPHCRADVHAYGRRCPTCREEFDWVPTSDETSPACARCLSPAQDEWLGERRRALGDEKAAARLATALGVPVPAAAAYLAVVGRGQCGWCGGTGLDLVDGEGKSRAPCPVCLGERRCVACAGDRRVLVGLEAAAVEVANYDALAQTLLAPNSPPSSSGGNCATPRASSCGGRSAPPRSSTCSSGPRSRRRRAGRPSRGGRRRRATHGGHGRVRGRVTGRGGSVRSRFSGRGTASRVACAAGAAAAPRRGSTCRARSARAPSRRCP